MIDWEEGSVPALLDGGEGPCGLLLAHGAGAGQHHPWMTAMRRMLGAALPTMTFDYRYIDAGRRSPDRMPILLAVHRAAAERFAGIVDHVVLAGKSMGGRVASHLAGDEGWPAAAMVYFGYPLVPLGKGEPRPTGHLANITVPQLFFSGSRDRLSPPDLMAPIVDGLRHGRLHVVADADHSFRVTKASGMTQEEVLRHLAEVTVEWVMRNASCVMRDA
jgi:hypothetical protein